MMMERTYTHTSEPRRHLSTGRKLSIPVVQADDVEDNLQLCTLEADGNSGGWFITLDKHMQNDKTRRHMSTERKLSKHQLQADDAADIYPEKILCKEKVKLTFMKADKDGDGWLTESEFISMLLNNVSTNKETACKIFKNVSKDSSKISFDDFYSHYECSFKKKNEEPKLQNNDDNSNNRLYSISEDNYKENSHSKSFEKSPALFKLLERSRSLIETQRKIQNSEDDMEDVENNFAKLFLNEDENETQKYISSRWDAFINFKRRGKNGEIVMTSEEDISDALPGNYDILRLVMDQFDSTIIQSKPKYATIKPVKWISSEGKGKHGKLLCPRHWNSTIPVDIGTNQNLSYYGACFATGQQRKVALLHRHATVDFVYSTNYHQDYVMQDGVNGSGAGGCGLETHAFHHMDCPLEDESGYFLLGKLVNHDEIHVTAFKIPTYHVLYVPPNVIHSNDYMVGKWRTMLADNVSIDHVYFMKEMETKSNKKIYKPATVEIS